LKQDAYVGHLPDDKCFNQPKTLSGIETEATAVLDVELASFNQPKTLSGIETNMVVCLTTSLLSFNQPKTLSGIET